MLGEVWHVLSDPAHVLAEFVWEATFLLVGILVTRWSIRREHKVLDAEHGFTHREEAPIPYDLTEAGWNINLEVPSQQ